MVGRSSTSQSGQQQADIFVIFGITGDLARVMTFRSLVSAGETRATAVPHRRRGVQRLDN